MDCVHTWRHALTDSQNVPLDMRGTDAKDAKTVAIIDLEMAAWIPEYHQDSIKMLHGRLDHNWCQFVADTIPGYDKAPDSNDEIMVKAGR